MLQGRSVFELKRDYLKALAFYEEHRVEMGGAAASAERARRYYRFIDRHGHELMADPGLLIPLAAAEPQDSLVRARALEYAERHRLYRPWLRLLNPPASDPYPGLLRVLVGHTGWVLSVCFSPDGRYCLSGSGDRTVRLWEVSTGQELRRFQGHTDGVWSVCFSPDGRYCLSGSRDRTVRLWEVSTGQELRRFQGHTDEVRSVCFSPDGRYCLSGGDDRTVRLWEVSTG